MYFPPLILLVVSLSVALAARQIRINNRCSFPVWISPLTSNNGAALNGGIQRLGQYLDYTYKIPEEGWKGRFWPKTNCDGQGQNCDVGQSIPPCPSNGCQPPAETKIEFFYPPVWDHARPLFYDISLVDGYTLPAEIIPSQTRGSCVTTNCRLSLDNCPSNEAYVGDLRVWKNGHITQCLSPCKKWNYPAPYGLNRNERHGEGIQFCCPTPPITPQQCQGGIVTQSQYVNLIHRDCPTAYSYAYDDQAGLHNCPNPTNFIVNFC